MRAPGSPPGRALAILDAHWLYVLILALFATVLVVLVALAASVVKATT
jgi:hypothetical protein